MQDRRATVEAGDTLKMFSGIASPEDLEEVRRNIDTLFFHRHSEAVVFRVMAFQETAGLRLRTSQAHEV